MITVFILLNTWLFWRVMDIRAWRKRTGSNDLLMDYSETCRWPEWFIIEIIIHGVTACLTVGFAIAFIIETMP